MPQIRQPARLAELRGFREPIVAPDAGDRERSFVGFADLVRMLAEGIADAQVSLDRASAGLLRELAETEVEVVPRVSEVVDANGDISYEQAKPEKVSLLSLGVTPTFYQFSQSTVEVAMDLKIVEEDRETEEGKRRFGLLAGTADVRAERKLNRDVSVHSKVTATLVPVPMPPRLEPSRTTATEEP